MMRRASILLTLAVLLTLAAIGCNTGGSTEDLEGTIVARVVATLEAAETAPPAAQTPPESMPTPTPPEPTATPAPPEPTPTPTPYGPTVTPPPEIEAEEYAVYSAMIEQNPIGYNLGSSILIREQTISDLDMLERALKYHDTLPPRLVDGYRSRNAALYTLDANFDVELDYALMPEEEFEEIFLQKGSVWARFQERYPEASGIVFFSRVGFGASEDDALVLMGYRCGDLCGSGGLYRLAKEDGSWKVQGALMIWES